MCAIVDANVAHEVFGPDPCPAGAQFFDWLNRRGGRLVVGGKQLRELEMNINGFLSWARQAINSGKMQRANESDVAAKKDQIEREDIYKSNDPHILALAQVSGARLLYSNDKNLQRDFKDKRLIDNPRGKVYTTLKGKDFTSVHRGLLANKNLCRTGK